MDQPVHNGEHRQWSYLEVVDRATGETECIRLDDQNSAVSVASAAEKIGMRRHQAWRILLDGGHLTTTGFVRRLS